MKALTMKQKVRFWGRADTTKTNDCWPWLGARLDNGYGQISINGKGVGAHRVAYFLATGDDPVGYFVCHSCDNPSCVSPSHLFKGTPKENTEDAIRKGRFVPKGTPRKLTPEIVVKIKEDYNNGISMSAIARKLGVAMSLIPAIIHRKIWKHVE